MNQSFLALSEQIVLYQNASLPPVAGTVNVCASVLVDEADEEPIWPAKSPLCGYRTVAATPV